MAKYRKKPVVIEAFQLTEACRKDQRQWSDGGGHLSGVWWIINMIVAIFIVEWSGES